MPTILPLLAALAILPSQTRDQTRAVIKARTGPARNPVTIQSAKPDTKPLEGRTLITVLPFEVASTDKDLSTQKFGMMDTVSADLRYVPTYRVADRSQVLAASPVSNKAIEETMLAHVGLGQFVHGTLSEDGPRLTIRLRLYSLDQEKRTEIAHSSASGPRDAIFAIADEALLKLLESAKVTLPGERILEIKKVPTEKFKAKAEVDAGRTLLDVIGKPGHVEVEVKKASEMALQHADAALKADKKYLAAYMLRASCHHSLDKNISDLKEDLRTARKCKDSDKDDMLASLELEGDENIYRHGNYGTAVKNFEQMLDYDPDNLVALWSLVALYAGDLDEHFELINSSSGARKAGYYAARLRHAHPDTSAAHVLKIKASGN